MQMPDINKKQLGVLIPLDLYARIKRAAEDRGLTISEFATIILQRECANIEITSADIYWIAEQVRHNEEIRAKRRATGGPTNGTR